MRQKILLIGLLGLLALYVFFAGSGVNTVFSSLQDEPPYDDSDLLPKPEPAPIPPEENAYTYYKKAQKKLVLSDEERKRLRPMLDREIPWDQSFADQLLSQNKEALAAFKEGQNRPVLQYPQEILNDGTQMRNPKIYLASLKRLQIETLRRQSKDKEALDETMGLFHFARQTGYVNFVVLGIGTDIYGLALDEFYFLLQQSTLPPVDFAFYIPKLQENRVTGTELAEVYRRQYTELQAFSELNNQKANLAAEAYAKNFPSPVSGPMMSTSAIILRYSNHMYSTKRQMSEYYRVLIFNAKSPYWQAKELPVIDRKPEKGLKFLQPNLIGRLNLAMMSLMTDFGEATLYIHIPNTRITLLQTYIALQHYKAEHGELPEALADLVPAYLPEIPIDPFDGNPIRYEPEAKKIYSIGIEKENYGTLLLTL